MATNKSTQDLLEALHMAVGSELLDRIKAGEAKPADIANAIKFLKDNDIQAMVTEDNPLKGLLDSLPFDTESLEHAMAH
jgi:hypothetical protein